MYRHIIMRQRTLKKSHSAHFVLIIYCWAGDLVLVWLVYSTRPIGENAFFSLQVVIN